MTERRRCLERRLRRAEEEYRGDPGFERGYRVFQRAISEAESELEEDSETARCYNESIQEVGERIRGFTDVQLKEESPALKSELLTANMQFFSFVSDKLTELTERVKNTLRPVKMPRRLKRLFLRFAIEMFMERLSRLISAFLRGLESTAKRLGALSFAITLNYAFVEVSFTFETKT